MKRRAYLSRACKRVRAERPEPAAEQEIGLLDLPNEILVMILQLGAVPPVFDGLMVGKEKMMRLWIYKTAIKLALVCRRFQDLFVIYTCAAVSMWPARMAEDFFAVNSFGKNSDFKGRPYKTADNVPRAVTCECALWELRFIRTLRAANNKVAFLPPRAMMERWGDNYYSAAIIFNDPRRPVFAFVWPTEMANVYALAHYSDRKPPAEIEERYPPIKRGLSDAN